jgi:hypothetical protein
MRAIGLFALACALVQGCASSHDDVGPGGGAGGDAGGGVDAGGAGPQDDVASPRADADTAADASGPAPRDAPEGDGAGDDAAPGGAIWHPTPGTSWQWQLVGTLDTSIDVKMYDIDLFETPQESIDALHREGRVVICYFSAGSSEPGRPDSGEFQTTDQGKVLEGWPDERWLDVRSTNVRRIMRARLDTARSKHCDGVEPDNVDGYANDNGLGLMEQDQLDYLAFLSSEAHGRGLSVGLKNTLALVPQVVGSFDWALNEECLQYTECDALAPFIAANKAVFHVEYGDASLLGTSCQDPTTKGFSTLIKKIELDAWRLACP